MRRDSENGLCEEEWTNCMVLLSDRKQHAVRKLSSHSSSISSSSSVLGQHECSVGTQTEPESIPPPSPTQQRTLRTVRITKNGMKSTKVFHSSTVCNTLKRSMKVTSLHTMSITFSGSLCRVGSLCGGRRQRQRIAGHWSIQVSWRLHDGVVCD